MLGNSKEKISWINGLKGLACLMVFCHHFFLSFYDAVYFGNEGIVRTVTGIDAGFGTKPYGVLINGNFAVCLFIMISAFLYAGKVMKATLNDKKLDFFSIAKKRYLRLMPSVALVGVIYYVLMNVLAKAGLNYTGVASELSISELFQHILLYQWITYDPLILGPLWCMYILFLGTFISMFLSLFSAKERFFMPVVYAVISVAALIINSYYVPVVFGVLLADIYYFDRINQWKLGFLNRGAVRYAGGVVLILIGLFFGGYPSCAYPENMIYALMYNSPLVPELIHSVGALLLMAGISVLPKQVILSSKPLAFLAEISFGIYLIHSVVINLLSYFMTDKFSVMTGNYHAGVFISFVITVIILVPLSVAFHKLFEEKILK